MNSPDGKYVFSFQEGDGKNKKLLGGKGANLCEMTQIGLNVPPGFVISTEACLSFLASDSGELPAGIMDEVHVQMRNRSEPTPTEDFLRPQTSCLSLPPRTAFEHAPRP